MALPQWDRPIQLLRQRVVTTLQRLEENPSILISADILHAHTPLILDSWIVEDARKSNVSDPLPLAEAGLGCQICGLSSNHSYTVGVDNTTIPIFSTNLLPMLRQVTGDQAFLTHHKRLDFLWDHQLQRPVLVLRERMASQLARREARLPTLIADDIIHTLCVDELQQSLTLVDAWLQALGDQEMENHLPLAEAGLDCPTCGLTFKHLYTLRRHELYAHGVLPATCPSFDIAQDAADGLPICRHCGDTFISWQNLRHHIASYACATFDSVKGTTGAAPRLPPQAFGVL